jgi:hypothetical protein
LFGRYNLLCNGCNWEFVGFALPGTVDSPTYRKRKKREETGKPESSVENNKGSANEFKAQSNANGNSSRLKVKKRVKVKLKE